MNKTNHPHEIIVSGIHLELTAGLKGYVREKSERLFRHEERIVRVKIELECDRKHDREHKFIVKGHIVIHGPDINDKRNHPHAIEFNGVELPKAI